MYFCIMEKKKTSAHPIDLNLKRIKEEGIVVLDNARGLPTGDKPFNFPDYVICIGQKGHIDLMYDDYLDYSEEQTVGVIFPNHILKEVRKTDNYLATLIVANATMLNDPMLQIINQMRYRYELHPCVKLDKHEFKMIMNLVELMKETSIIDLPDRKVLMVRQLEFFLRMLSHYRSKKLNESSSAVPLSEQFYANLKRHARQHHDVEFYANLACITPKYFTTVIKQETGRTASYWIHNHIVAEAKMLLHIRPDLSVQAIAFMLGFEEQTAFSRYFKREVGMSPTEFRNANTQ